MAVMPAADPRRLEQGGVLRDDRKRLSATGTIQKVLPGRELSRNRRCAGTDGESRRGCVVSCRVPPETNSENIAVL
jgi:hypothetical protein